MAAIFILAGGLLGFASAIGSMILIDASVLMALGIWCGVGLAFFAIGLGLALAPRQAAAPARQSQSA
ncbi:hypothetical protein [Pseudotabrizicola sp. L79]|uniref:hypothetical protein n=1 Tax=Pseudotabrizicola sp. L79 TaxID=3118402 RepID=UPI002F9433CF